MHIPHTHSFKSEIKQNLALSIPLIASQLIYACSGFIGTALIAHLGEVALAASVLVSMIWMSLSMLFFGMLNSISVLVSHQNGAKNNKAISSIMGQAFILGIFISITIILLLYFMPIFLHMTAQPKPVIEVAIAYMRALLWEVPSLILLIIYEQFLAGINRTRFVLRISLLVVPIEIPIIYLLIFGKFGFPECGVAGIGYGFAITYTGTAIFLTVYFLRSKFYDQFHLFSQIKKFNFHWFSELIRIGLPMGFMHVIEVGAFTIMTFWIAQFGTTTLAAHQIVMQYLGFVITIAFAMSQTLTIRVGYSVGKKDILGIHYAIYIGLFLNLISSLALIIIFVFLSHFLLLIDINIYAPENTDLVRDATTLLAICGVLLVFDSFRIIGFGALRGLKDTKFSMYTSFFAFGLVGLGFGFLFAFSYQWKSVGVWWGMTIGILTGMIIVLIRVFHLLKSINMKKLTEINRINIL